MIIIWRFASFATCRLSKISEHLKGIVSYKNNLSIYISTDFSFPHWTVWAAWHFFSGHPYIESTTVLSDYFLWHFFPICLYALFAVPSLFGCLCHHCPCVKRDTSGQERFRDIITAFYRGAKVCIVIIIMVKWKRSLFSVSPWCSPTF